jgi:hypothetical protein
MQVAHKNKALLDHKQIEAGEEIEDDEEFDMNSVVIPDLGLGNHAVSEQYQEEVSQVIYCDYGFRLTLQLTVGVSRLGVA